MKEELVFREKQASMSVLHGMMERWNNDGTGNGLSRKSSIARCERQAEDKEPTTGCRGRATFQSFAIPKFHTSLDGCDGIKGRDL